MQYRHEIGDMVKFKCEDHELAGNRSFRVTDIDRGLNGAYDWDDVSLEGVKGKFCEFDLEPATDN